MLEQILDIQLQDIQKMLKKEKNINLTWSQSVKNFVIKHWTDEKYGARPLKRAIQNYILDELSMQIIEGKIKDGQDVYLDIINDKLEIG